MLLNLYRSNTLAYLIARVWPVLQPILAHDSAAISQSLACFATRTWPVLQPVLEQPHTAQLLINTDWDKIVYQFLIIDILD